MFTRELEHTGRSHQKLQAAMCISRGHGAFPRRRRRCQTRGARPREHPDPLSGRRRAQLTKAAACWGRAKRSIPPAEFGRGAWRRARDAYCGGRSVDAAVAPVARHLGQSSESRVLDNPVRCYYTGPRPTRSDGDHSSEEAEFAPGGSLPQLGDAAEPCLREQPGWVDQQAASYLML